MAILTPTINSTTGLAQLPSRPGHPYYKVLWNDVTSTFNGITKTTRNVQKPRYDATDVNAYSNVLAGDTWADIVSAAAAVTPTPVILPPNPKLGP
jgi:hypothetical protein